MHIAVVDDEVYIRKSLGNFLRNLGHTVYVYGSGHQVLKAIETNGGPDLVVSDVCMPGLRGTTLVQRVRETHPEIDFVLITGFSHTVDTTSAIELGACAYLKKPIKLRELELIINQIERQRKAHRKVRNLETELQDERKLREDEISDRMFARRLHSQIFPKDLSWLRFTDVHVRHLPMAAVGGDYVDLRAYGQHEALIIVADVSGHGTPAAFGGIALKTWFTGLEEGLAPNMILAQADRLIAEMFPDEFFATAFCCRYNEKKCELTYSNAGHPDPFILSPIAPARILKGDGAALGISERAVRGTRTVELGKHDVLVAFTDGLTEDSAELAQLLEHTLQRETSSVDLAALSRDVLDAAVEHAPLRAFSDDLSMLLISPARPASTCFETSLTGKLVIVYDDEEAMRDFLKEVLTIAGMRVVCKESADGCVDDVAKEQPDLVLLDVQMKGISGLAALEMLRASHPHLPVMVISGHDVAGNARAALEGSAAVFMAKPVDPRDLVSAIESALNLRPDTDSIEFDNTGADWLDFVISSSPATLDLLSRYLQSLGRQPVPPDCLQDVLYCIREIAGNAIEWGNLNQRALKVRISTVLQNDRVMVKVADEGAGFDVRRNLEERDVLEAQQERERLGKRDGGFGLSIVRSLMDEVSFSKRGNVVMMTKLFHPEDTVATNNDT